ncbi:MAG: DNA sulfur modification protein DndD [Acidobacteria bacterium]|nr:MAG: DNA sulfur modification protein DndD [Acidobacteriota bacterium]
MILNTITLSNFGVFAGKQTIDLTPTRSKNIVLFGGKNGAGKSTLLEAIRLCLYGQSAYPELTSRPKYECYLESKIHADPNALIQPLFASVSLRFTFSEEDGSHVFDLTRLWERKSDSKVIEQFDLTRDGVPVDDVSAEYWQDFVRDLMPLGISQLFFFDGEKIQQLAEDASDQQTLAEAVKSMLGLDIIERLHVDIGIYRSRSLRAAREWRENEKLSALEDQLEAARQKLQSAVGEQHLALLKVDETKEQIAELNVEIAAQGGNFAKNRERLVLQQAKLKAEIDKHHEAIRDLAGGLLPFALVTELCSSLKKQLQVEQSQANAQAVSRSLDKIKQRLLADLKTGQLKESLARSPRHVRDQVEERLLALVSSGSGKTAAKPVSPIHSLSLEESSQLQVWIDQASQIPGRVKDSARALERFYRELHACESDLAKVPPDEVLAPLVVKLQNLHEQLGRTSSEALAGAEKVALLQQQLLEIERAHKRLCESAAESVGVQKNLALAERMQAALSDYKNEIIRKRIGHLQEALTECFNLLARKKDALRRILVDPEGFSVTLLDKRGHCVPKSQLSAGEKQIYAISVLWALAKVSGRPLPMIIDTPLARLDSEHRQSLARFYFPLASHQTIILSTDTEIDEACFDGLRKSICKAYKLEFDQQEGGTFVRTGYFWKGSNEAN